MSAAVIQLLVLAGIAIFPDPAPRSVLGTREGFEKPPASGLNESKSDRRGRPIPTSKSSKAVSITTSPTMPKKAATTAERAGLR